MSAHPARVAVIGAGTMGAGLVRLFAGGGHRVAVFDPRPGVADAAVGDRAGARPASTLDDAVATVDVCVEAIVEDLEAKRALFARLAELTGPDTVLATNTSALSVTAIAEGVPADARPRVLGAHFFNPPDVIPAVEVVRTPASGEAALARMSALLEGVGKEVAVVRDTPGFVANRIQHAMVLEAWRCLAEGVADARAIDVIVSASFGFRLFAYGPFQLGDFNGLDVYLSVHRSLEAAYGERFAPPPELEALVERGEVGVKAGRGVFAYEEGEAAELVRQRDALLARLAEVREREL